MRHYEIVFLVHSNQSEEQVNATVDRYKALITKNKGNVDRFEDWGRRPLSYPINKTTKAHYILMNVTCDLQTLQEIQSSFRHNDAIIRELILSTKHPVTEPSPMMRQLKAAAEQEQQEQSKKASSDAAADQTEEEKEEEAAPSLESNSSSEASSEENDTASDDS